MLQNVLGRLGTLPSLASVVPLLAVLTLWGSAVGGAVSADEAYVSEWGPAIGTSLPLLEARDQHGEIRNFDNLSGNNGLLLFFNRSTDW